MKCSPRDPLFKKHFFYCEELRSLVSDKECDNAFFSRVESVHDSTFPPFPIPRSHPKVQEKLKTSLRKWAEGEFKGDPQLNLIPSLYASLRRDGIDFSSPEQVGQGGLFKNKKNLYIF